MKRGGHKIILFFNVLAVISLFTIVAINDLDVNAAYLLLGFSPSILALLINGYMDNKIKDHYYYLLVPFGVTAFFILISVIFLGRITTGMDLETLAGINFIFTLLFSFIFYFNSKDVEKKKRKILHKKAEEHEIKREEKEQVVTHEHVVKHVYEPLEYKEVTPPDNVNPYIDELKTEFDIININQEKIIDSLKNLASETKKETKIEVHDILDKLEKDKIFFASTTGEKFHKPLCIVINHIHHDKIVAFKDEKEAEMEGFKPCRVCMPDNE